MLRPGILAWPSHHRGAGDGSPARPLVVNRSFVSGWLNGRRRQVAPCTRTNLRRAVPTPV